MSVSIAARSARSVSARARQLLATWAFRSSSAALAATARAASSSSDGSTTVLSIPAATASSGVKGSARSDRRG